MPNIDSRLDEDSPVSAFLRDFMFAAGGVIARNPVVVGGATAFVVTMFYVCGNALWNQKQPHESAFFITREMTHFASQETDAGNVPALPDVPAHRIADPVVQQAQKMLATLGLYEGAIDGLTGPQTREAVEAFQKLMGLDATGKIDQQFIDLLRAEERAAAPGAIDPSPVSANPPAATGFTKVDIEKVQAGLRAFGHDAIEIDGIMGPKTSSAIREFQALFGLPETGEPDRRLIAKMGEIGLTN